MEKQPLNRIKVMLAERMLTNKQLAEMLGKDPATISKWVTNTSQPTLENLIEIARCLKCDMNDLVRLDDVVTIKTDKLTHTEKTLCQQTRMRNFATGFWTDALAIFIEHIALRTSLTRSMSPSWISMARRSASVRYVKTSNI